MKFRKLFVLFAYGVGALLDAGAAAAILANYLNGMGDAKEILLRDAGRAFALMVGWTLLLIWGVLKPYERRGVLLLTAFPVMALLEMNNILLPVNGIISWGESWGNIIGAFILMIIFSVAYVFASVNGKTKDAG